MAICLATSFLANGIRYLALWARTGRLKGIDRIIAVPAWLGNFLIVAGCIWAWSRLAHKRAGDAVLLSATFILATGFFAADMALFQPRYLSHLSLFPQLLHPHLP